MATPRYSLTASLRSHRRQGGYSPLFGPRTTPRPHRAFGDWVLAPAAERPAPAGSRPR